MPSPRSARFKGWNAADPFSGSVKTFNLDGEESSAQYHIYFTIHIYILECFILYE